MAGSDGGGLVNVQAFADRFSAAEVMAELRYWGGVGTASADAPESVTSTSTTPTVQRRVLFMDGEFAGETHTVDVGADGVFSGRFMKTWRRGETVHLRVRYTVEEIRLGFGDTVFLGFVPADERPSWPQRVADALAFIEAETEAQAERERLLAEEKAKEALALERQRYCRHHRQVKLKHPTPEDPHRYRTVCRDCDWSVEFEGPDTCSFCRYDPVPLPHPDRPDTAWVFCVHCGSNHEVSLATQRAMNLRD